MNLYGFESYREYLKNRIAALPRKGYGEISRIARALNVDTSFVSQVLQGKKDFTREQGHECASYLALGTEEIRYFLLLIDYERAGSRKLKRFLRQEIEKIQKESAEEPFQISESTTLSHREASVFYSNWYFSACRILTSIKEFRTLSAISERLGLPPENAERVLDFLVSVGLCVYKGGRYELGPKATYSDPDSPFTIRHHTNWSMKALETLDYKKKSDFFYTNVVSISKEDLGLLYEKLNDWVHKEFSPIIEETEPETMACVVMNWFEV